MGVRVRRWIGRGDATGRLTARNRQGCLAANALLRIGVWPRSAAGGLLDEERGALRRVAAERSRETDGEKRSAVPCGGLLGGRESITTGCPRKPVKLERCGMRPAFCQERNPVKTSWMRDAVRVFAKNLSIPEQAGIDKKKSRRANISPDEFHRMMKSYPFKSSPDFRSFPLFSILRRAQCRISVEIFVRRTRTIWRTVSPRLRKENQSDRAMRSRNATAPI